MQIVSKTDIGLVRNSNQDSFAAGELTPDTCWAVVCDGMGGANGGNVASANAVKIISDYISSSYQPAMGSNSIKTILQSAFCGANIRLNEMAKNIESLKGMGTTAVVCVVSKSVAHIAHAGDSRAYLIRDGVLTQITKDHSVVQSMVDRGEITREEAKVHPQRNVITRALGVEEQIEFEYNEVDILPNDKILMCTDGLYNFIDEDVLTKTIIAEPLDELPQKLISLANNGGGQDNITLVVLSEESN